jgi:hypothetical protein
MSGVFQATRLFYSAGWRRRTFLSATLLLMIVSALIEHAAGHSLNSFTLFLIGAAGQWVMTLGGLLVMAGSIFRAASAPQALRLLPFGRLRLLLGLLLALPLFAAFDTVLSVLQHLGDATAANGWAGEVGRFFKTLALESLFLLLWVLIAASQTYLWLFTILLALAMALAMAVVPFRALSALLAVWHETAALFLLALCGWAVFAAWYLRAPRISVLNWREEQQPDLLHHFQRRGSGAVSSRAAAIRYQLLGEPSVIGAALRIAGPIVVVYMMLILVVLALNRRHPEIWSHMMRHWPVVSIYAQLILTSSVCGTESTAVRAMVGRSRILWICGAQTRAESFALCERIAWSCFAVIAGLVLAVGAVGWMLLPHRSGNWAAATIVFPVPAILCCMYLAFMNVGDRLRVVLIVAYVFLYAAFYLEASASHFSPAVAGLLQIAVPAATLAGAACLRRIAARRWQNIDWLTVKPEIAIGGLSTRRA